MTAIDRQIYVRCLDHFREISSREFLVSDSIPVPYFGDISSYLGSEHRILTAALNPSDREFSDVRFDIAAGLDSPEGLEAELSKYFKINPYKKWFSSFEPVLNAMSASYGGKMSVFPYRNTALHVDVLSPLATSPTWSKLAPDQRAELESTGNKIFRSLISELKPDLVVASLGQAYKDKLVGGFPIKGDPLIVREYDRDRHGNPMRPLRVLAWRIDDPNKPWMLVNGTPFQTPFGKFTTERKKEIGALLKGLKNAAT